MDDQDNEGSATTQSSDTATSTIKTYLYIALVLAVGLGGAFGAATVFLGRAPASETPARILAQSASRQQSSPAEQPAVVRIAIDGRPFSGPPDARVTLVEFTDYECPFCARYFQLTLPLLRRVYDGEIKFVIMNYPLPFHPFAQKAAEAAECAYDQRKFWEYHDALFRNIQALDPDSLKAYASALGLDTEAFDTCLDSGAKAQQVLDDIRDGQSYGVSGTPSFFINGQRLVGARPFASFKTLIDAALGE